MNGEIRILHATRPGRCEEPRERKKEKDRIDAMTVKCLMRSFLCERECSLCVTKGECECLDVCKYGQRYIEIVKGMPYHRLVKPGDLR